MIIQKQMRKSVENWCCCGDGAPQPAAQMPSGCGPGNVRVSTGEGLAAQLSLSSVSALDNEMLKKKSKCLNAPIQHTFVPNKITNEIQVIVIKGTVSRINIYIK